jgi:uncharacterized DUF497 family protein
MSYRQVDVEEASATVRKINGIRWLEQFVRKLAIKHQVEQAEVEEVFASNPRFRFIEKGDQTGENKYMALGQTDSGRYLTVFFLHKLDGWALVISARDMADKERRMYERK